MFKSSWYLKYCKDCRSYEVKDAKDNPQALPSIKFQFHNFLSVLILFFEFILRMKNYMYAKEECQAILAVELRLCFRYNNLNLTIIAKFYNLGGVNVSYPSA
mgnify:CR=1 FL=1